MADIKRKNQRQSEEFVESVLKVRRVAKVIRGGRRFAFSALVVVGNRNGMVGIALGKSREVSSAIVKAFRKARKYMISVPLYKTTIPFTVEGRHGASKVLIRSASKGTGVIAGGAVRHIMEALGVKDVLTKTLGSSNPHNNAEAVFHALKKLKSAKQLAYIRGKSINEICGVKDVAAE